MGAMSIALKNLKLSFLATGWSKIAVCGAEYRSQIIQSMHFGRQPTMDTQELLIHDSS